MLFVQEQNFIVNYKLYKMLIYIILRRMLQQQVVMVEGFKLTIILSLNLFKNKYSFSIQYIKINL
jgi:phosphoketolase